MSEYQPQPRTAGARSLLIPFLILGVSFAVILTWQVTMITAQGRSMSDARGQLIEAIQKREELVKQSTELQNKLQALVIDLLALAKTNEKAQAIVQKYNIQQQAPAAQ